MIKKQESYKHNMMQNLKCIFNKNMKFSIEDENNDVTVNLIEKVKQKRRDLKALQINDKMGK